MLTMFAQDLSYKNPPLKTKGGAPAKPSPLGREPPVQRAAWKPFAAPFGKLGAGRTGPSYPQGKPALQKLRKAKSASPSTRKTGIRLRPSAYVYYNARVNRLGGELSSRHDKVLAEAISG